MISSEALLTPPSLGCTIEEQAMTRKRCQRWHIGIVG
ncbi:unnamed protein product [Victoria cruziana]